MVRCSAVFGGGIVAVVLYRGAVAADYSFAVSLVVGWYRQAKIRKAFENLKPFFGNGETTVKSGGRKSKIIDAEFEVVDEKDRKN